MILAFDGKKYNFVTNKECGRMRDLNIVSNYFLGKKFLNLERNSVVLIILLNIVLSLTACELV